MSKIFVLGVTSIGDNINYISMNVRRFFLTILLMTGNGLNVNGHVTNTIAHGDISTAPIHDAISGHMGYEIRLATDDGDTDGIENNREKALNMYKKDDESSESLGIFILKLKFKYF